MGISLLTTVEYLQCVARVQTVTRLLGYVHILSFLQSSRTIRMWPHSQILLIRFLMVTVMRVFSLSFRFTCSGSSLMNISLRVVQLTCVA